MAAVQEWVMSGLRWNGSLPLPHDRPVVVTGNVRMRDAPASGNPVDANHANGAAEPALRVVIHPFHGSNVRY